MDIKQLIPEIDPAKKEAMSKKKIMTIFIFIITSALIVTAVVIFWPFEMGTRFVFRTDEYVKLDGSTVYYENSNRNFLFKIDDRESIEELVTLIGDFKGVRTFREKEKPLLFGDHIYRFNFSDSHSGYHMSVEFNGRYIQINDNGNYVKYRIFPKEKSLSIIDIMVLEHVIEDYSNRPLVPIAFSDKSDTIDDYGSGFPGWVNVEWLDAHHGKYYTVTFNDFKPYTNVSFYEDDSKLVIFYDEGEGEVGEYNFRLERLPCHPHNLDAEIVLILNGERYYNVNFIYAIE